MRVKGSPAGRILIEKQLYYYAIRENTKTKYSSRKKLANIAGELTRQEGNVGGVMRIPATS
jgi:hypothetical protein